MKITYNFAHKNLFNRTTRTQVILEVNDKISVKTTGHEILTIDDAITGYMNSEQQKCTTLDISLDEDEREKVLSLLEFDYSNIGLKKMCESTELDDLFAENAYEVLSSIKRGTHLQCMAGLLSC